MRTFSLMNLQNRLAAEGEELVAHRFLNGWIGMVSRDDFELWRRARERSSAAERSVPAETASSLWQSITTTIMEFLSYYGFTSEAPSGDGEPGPLVGIPCESLLRVFGIPADWQNQYHFGPSEDALFIESSSALGARRDALCFGNGIIIPLQFLNDGQKVQVLRRSWADSLEPELLGTRA